MNFKITKDPHISLKRYVWFNGVCIGYYFCKIYENKNIDWAKYRADKTLKMRISDRWHNEYHPTAFPSISCTKCTSEKEAALAILAKHNLRFADLDDYREIKIGLEDEE